MDTFENDEFTKDTEQEPIPLGPEEPAAEDAGYHGVGAVRKESPYADSPYVRVEQPRQEYQYQPQTQPPEKPPKEPKAKKPVWKGLAAVGLAAAVVAGSCGVTAYCVNDYWEDRNEETVEMLTEKIADLQKQINSASSGVAVSSPIVPGEGLTPGQLYNQCADSVVAISCTLQASGYGGGGTSRGSGFILSEDGYVLTNYHVVEGASAISVITHDGTEYTATLVGYDDSANDLAVLKAEATGLQAATIGKSSDLVIGDMVVAIGNPLGTLTATQTVGYVSGIGREVATGSLTTISMIQTDAAINPGNSGGPLFNMRGEVVGITTAKYSGTTSSGATIEGIGFAIPIDDVMNVVDDLIDYGYVTGAYMGVTVQNTDETSAAMFGIPTGAYIVSVEKGGAADRAGIQPKDIVIRVGDYQVSNVTDLTRALRHFDAGDTTLVTVIRSGGEVQLEITLDEKPHGTDNSTTQTQPTMPSGNYDEWYEYFRRYFGG